VLESAKVKAFVEQPDNFQKVSSHADCTAVHKVDSPGTAVAVRFRDGIELLATRVIDGSAIPVDDTSCSGNLQRIAIEILSWTNDACLWIGLRERNHAR